MVLKWRTAACVVLFQFGLAPVAPAQDALRADLERTFARARAAVQAGDFDTFMTVYEPAKGLALTREQWPTAAAVLQSILARPIESLFESAHRRGWWAGYYVRDRTDDPAVLCITQYRFHMGTEGWKLRGENASKCFPPDAGLLQREIETNPAFALPE